MRDRVDEFGDAVVAVVTFGTPELAARYREHLDLPFPILSDTDRSLYRQFDLGRGSVWAVWGPGTIAAYIKLLARGRKPQSPRQAEGQDVRQLGGDFVFDRTGRLAVAIRPSSPDTRPPVDQLVQAVTALK